MPYLVLARKYRPQKFGDLTGQQTISKILQSAILQNRLAHAYLFSGPRGIGKTTSARIFAKALNCHKVDPKSKNAQAEPCDQCSSCQEITRGSSLDVMELDAASHTQVDKIREVIIDTVNFAPVRDRCKVFIIDEVHMLSSHSFNALLKTLEEPPPHVVFILATTDFHKIPTTIVSRCQRFRFLPLTPKEIFSNLQSIAKAEKIPTTDDALLLVAKAAAGAMRDGLSIFDQVISHLPQGKSGEFTETIDLGKVEEVLGVVRENFLLEFLEKLAKRDARAALESVSLLLREGYDLSYFLKELREAFREMLIQKCGWRDEDTVFRVGKPLPVESFSNEQIMRAIQMLTKCAEQMRWNDLPHVVFECYIVRLCQEAVSAGDLLKRLEKLEERSRSGSSGSSAAGSAFGSGTNDRTPATSTRSAQPSVESSAPVSSLESETFQPIQPGGAWPKVMAILQNAKPFLHQVLETAAVQIYPDRVELSFAKSFSLETAKRNASAVEKVLQDVAKTKIALILKQGDARASGSPQPSAPQAVREPAPEYSAEVEVEDQEPESAESEPEAAFAEDPATPPTPRDANSIEDEGARNFLRHFSGKITPSTENKPH